MIVQQLDDGRLWCINQSSHAVQAAEFCRAWGNGDVAPVPPKIASVVDLAVMVHDNGWLAWERSPELRADGYPMDFLAGPVWWTKLELWSAGIEAAFDQHPYAGVLVARHAATLYERMVGQIADPAERSETARFIAAQDGVVARARQLLGAIEPWREALSEPLIDGCTRLLQYGDLASLRVCVPWAADADLPRCPVDFAGGTQPIRMVHGDGDIRLDPWPYSVPGFEVSIWGRVLDQRNFADTTAYRQQLAQAPVLERRWWVHPL